MAKEDKLTVKFNLDFQFKGPSGEVEPTAIKRAHELVGEFLTRLAGDSVDSRSKMTLLGLKLYEQGYLDIDKKDIKYIMDKLVGTNLANIYWHQVNEVAEKAIDEYDELNKKNKGTDAG